jgi:DNA-binding transcriptional LysR family regulator
MLEMHSYHGYMSQMNWGAFDLNLLIVFDAVMQERSVTRAGSRIGLSQPAMSHALNRLRHMLKDELFVRTPDGMVPTPRAELLAQPLRNALSEMQLALEPAVFDPASSERRFTLAVNNYAAVVIVPPLVAAVSAAAPAVRLDLEPSGTLDLAGRLDRGDLDLTLSNAETPGERFATLSLLEDPFVMVMRRGHPASRRKLSPAAYADLPHLEISSSHENTGFVDSWLAEHGFARRIALRAPFISAASILVQSDVVVTLSRRIAQELVRNHPLQLREPPYDSARVRTAMLWHRRLDRHPAHRWLRDVIVRVAKSL